MKTRSQDSDDIERAVYDGMQDLRVPKTVAKLRLKKKAKPKRPTRRRG
jgi:hypothetical protein